MATIKLTDNSSLAGDATILDDSVIGKTPASAIKFLRSDVIGAMNQTLDQVQINTLSIGFDYQPCFSLKGDSASFTAGGGLTGEFELFKPAKAGTPSPLFPADQFGSEIEMHGSYYLSLGFQLSLNAKSTDATGAFLLVPNLTAAADAKLYLPFPANAAGAYPTLKTAVETLCGAYLLPSSASDMKALPSGAVFVYDAQGSVGFNAQFDVLAAVNPTASLGKSTGYGPIKIDAGPSITLGGGFTLYGDIKVRLWNKDGNFIQLGYYKKHGTTLSVSFDASAGVDVAVGEYDVIAKIYGLLGDSGSLDDAWMKANIPTSVADDVETAYQTAVQTKLSIAIDEECDTTITDQAAFSWNFDTSAMDANAQSAFERAIHGDLSGLMGVSALPTGVTKAGSIFDRLKATKHTFTFNFLGLFDYASVQTASLNMSVKVSDDGQVVITDTAGLARLSATATPFVKSDLLRKVLAEDFVATVGYCTSLGSLAAQLKVNYSYYNYASHAHSSDLLEYVGAAGVLVKSSKPSVDWQSFLQGTLPSQSASLFALLQYDNPAATRLFFDEHSVSRTIEDYERIGRQALTVTPGLGLGNIFVGYLKDDARWLQLVNAGSVGNFYAALGVDLSSPPQWATVAYAWKQHIMVWAPAMHSAAQALQNILQYAAQHPGLSPLQDSGFLQRRQTLASQLKSAVQATPMFSNTLGVITIALAAAPSVESVVISYAGKTTTYP